MSRAAYWTIIAGGQPTAFRGRDREDLLPTLKQLQSKQPDAAIVWFERGKVFPTREAALEDRRGPRERRPRDWRPGGDHKDPRAKYDVPRDQKRARFKQLAQKRRMRDEEPGDRGGFDPFAERPRKPFGDRAPRENRPPFGDRRPAGGGNRNPFGDRRPAGGDRRPAGGGRGPWQDRESGDRRPAGGARKPGGWGSGRPQSGGRGPGTGRPPGGPGRPPGGPGTGRAPGGRPSGSPGIGRPPGGRPPGGPGRSPSGGRGPGSSRPGGAGRPGGGGRPPGGRGPGGRGPGGRGPGGRPPGGRGPGGRGGGRG